ncbi:MAG: ABC transporter ATP-binding protein [Clostridiaceae bacterium]|nr:ABC transporter ATP-binding protein [Clostridiaceae bacterium]
MSFIIPLLGKKLASEKQKAFMESNNAFISVIKEMLDAFSTITYYKIHDEVVASISEKSNHQENSSASYNRVTGIIGVAVHISTYLVMLSVFLVGAFLVSMGKTTYGDVLALFNVMNYFTNPLKKIGSKYSKYVSAKNITEKIRNICAQSVYEGKIVDKFGKEIELRNVSF